MSSRRHRARGLVALAALLLGASMLSACDNGPDLPGTGGSADDTTGASSGPDGDQTRTTRTTRTNPTTSPTGSISTNVERKTDVPVDTLLTVRAHNGRLSTVNVSGAGDVGELPGAISGDAEQLAGRRPARARHDLHRQGGRGATTASGDQAPSFTTQDLTLDQQTYPSVAPLPGETVGVGMPVIVTFDIPVTDRAVDREHMTVTSAPDQPGTWHWISDTEVALPAEEVLEGRHQGRRRRRHQRCRRRQRDLRPGGPRGQVRRR